MYDSTYITFRKRQNYWDRKKITPGTRGSGGAVSGKAKLWGDRKPTKIKNKIFSLDNAVMLHFLEVKSIQNGNSDNSRLNIFQLALSTQYISFLVLKPLISAFFAYLTIVPLSVSCWSTSHPIITFLLFSFWKTPAKIFLNIYQTSLLRRQKWAAVQLIHFPHSYWVPKGWGPDLKQDNHSFTFHRAYILVKTTKQMIKIKWRKSE